jgi:GMP synthase (glutamine-hydrolysing)
VTQRPRILVIEHEADDPPAWFGVWLEDAGCDLHVCQPWAGDSLPEDLSGHDGLLVMGGWMSAHHDADVAWLSGVKELLREAARDAVPTLGICLGHQVAAVALGGLVIKNPQGQQIGLYDVDWSPEAANDPLMGVAAGAGAQPQQGIHWNSDIVTDLPEGAVVLARAAGGEIQAARFTESMWGVQWHPEIDAPLLRRWADDDPEGPKLMGLDVEVELARVDAARAALDAAWRPVAERFATIVAGARR